MEKEKTARAVIETQYNGKDCIVSIKRIKYNNGKIQKEYYTIPGGHVENNETYEETVVREVLEELNVEVSIKEKLLSCYNSDLDRYEDFFICDIISGNIEKGNGPEWINPDIEKYGSYEIVYIETKDIEKYNLLPNNVKEILIKRYSNI